MDCDSYNSIHDECYQDKMVQQNKQLQLLDNRENKIKRKYNGHSTNLRKREIGSNVIRQRATQHKELQSQSQSQYRKETETEKEK